MFEKLKKTLIKKRSRIRLMREYTSIVQSGYCWSKGFASIADVSGGAWHVVSSTERLLSTDYYRRLGESSHSIYWIKAGSHARRQREDNLSRFVEHTLPSIDRPFSLITSDGDSSALELVTQSGGASILSSRWLLGWWSQNAQKGEYIRGKISPQTYNEYMKHVSPIPIGLDLHTPRAEGVGVKVLNLLRECGSTCRQRRPKILVDCCIRQTSPERVAFCRSLKNNPHLEVLSDRVSQADLWKLYRNYLAVLALPGYGLDCHRTWEALYLGCIPIVLNVGLDNLYSRFSVKPLVIESIEDTDWGELIEQAREIGSNNQIEFSYRALLNTAI